MGFESGTLYLQALHSSSYQLCLSHSLKMKRNEKPYNYERPGQNWGMTIITSSGILLKARLFTLEHVDKEQLTIMFTKALYANQFKNISSGQGTCTIKELYQLQIWRNVT